MVVLKTGQAILFLTIQFFFCLLPSSLRVRGGKINLGPLLGKFVTIPIDGYF